MALQNNIDINFIDGSGPRGRIVKKDIDILLNKNNDLNKKVNYNYKENKSKKITSMRKVIAKRLILSKSTIPHFYLNINCNADNLLIARKDMNFDKMYANTLGDAEVAPYDAAVAPVSSPADVNSADVNALA